MRNVQPWENQASIFASLIRCEHIETKRCLVHALKGYMNLNFNPCTFLRKHLAFNTEKSFKNTFHQITFLVKFIRTCKALPNSKKGREELSFVDCRETSSHIFDNPQYSNRSGKVVHNGTKNTFCPITPLQILGLHFFFQRAAKCFAHIC